MDGCLIRELDGAVPDSIELDGSIRIAAFDREDVLRILDCTGTCAARENLHRGYRLYAMEQGTSLLHFALRSLLPCKYPTMEESYWIGANGHVRIRAGNAGGMLRLLRASNESKLTLEDAYCVVQEGFEQAWRQALAQLNAGREWTSDACLAGMKSLEKEMSAIARKLFGMHGMLVCGDLVIHDVSSPLYI